MTNIIYLTIMNLPQTHLFVLLQIFMILPQHIKYPFPVQDSFNEKYFLSINYSSLSRYESSYSYSNSLNVTEDNDVYIKKFDFESSSINTLIELNDLRRFYSNKTFDTAYHTINHVMIFSCGNKFIFIHRYYINNVRNDKLFLFRFV